MSKTNCCNCGAALDIWKDKCEFCGTKNVNLTALDLASGEPANFIFRLPSNIQVVNELGEEIYMTTFAIPSLETIEMVNDTCDITGGWGQAPLARFCSCRKMEMGLKLTTVPRQYNNKEILCELRVKDK